MATYRDLTTDASPLARATSPFPADVAPPAWSRAGQPRAGRPWPPAAASATLANTGSHPIKPVRERRRSTAPRGGQQQVTTRLQCPSPRIRQRAQTAAVREGQSRQIHDDRRPRGGGSRQGTRKPGGVADVQAPRAVRPQHNQHTGWNSHRYQPPVGPPASAARRGLGPATTPARPWQRSRPGCKTHWTWMRSEMTWPVLCTRPWNPPTCQSGLAHVTSCFADSAGDVVHSMVRRRCGGFRR